MRYNIARLQEDAMAIINEPDAQLHESMDVLEVTINKNIALRQLQSGGVP
jgi:hypothetical protein